MQLRIDGVDVGAPVALVGGTATFPAVTSLSAGPHTVAAVYSRQLQLRRTGQDSLTQNVTKADTSTLVLATPSPAVEGQAATLTARVGAVAPGSGAPDRHRRFTANGDPLGAAPLAAGLRWRRGAIDISDLPAGRYTIIATYAGDGDYNGSESAPITHEVIAAAAVVETTHGGDVLGEPVDVRRADHVHRERDRRGRHCARRAPCSSPLDGADFGDPVPVGPDGIAESATLASPDPGDHTVIAAFTGAAGYSGSGDILTQTVDAAGVDVGLTSSDASSDYGQAVTFTATITSQQVGTGAPTGYVQFVLDGQPLGDAVELDGDGEGTSQSVSNLLPGDHDVRALYSGDVHFVSGATRSPRTSPRSRPPRRWPPRRPRTTFGQTVQLNATVDPGASAPPAPRAAP